MQQSSGKILANPPLLWEVMSRRTEYRRYLSSTEWKQNRDLALARTNGFCQFCGKVAKHVHHVKYPKQFGYEHPHTLIPVCEQCHKLSHGVQQMETLTEAERLSDNSPTGTRFNYLVSGGRVYASADAWVRALQVPLTLQAWFTTGLPRNAMLKRDSAGGALHAEHMGVEVFRWHVVGELLRAFDRNFYNHQYDSRPPEEKKALEHFHANYEKIVAWGYDLQERAMHHAIHQKVEPAAPVSQQTLIDALREAVRPRLEEHGEKLQKHDIVITEIKEAVPALRDAEEFISVKQGAHEQGFDPTEMPWFPRSKETLTQLAGRLLKGRGVDRGGDVVVRLDGLKQTTPVGTYRRRDVYAVFSEIKQQSPSTGQAPLLPPGD